MLLESKQTKYPVNILCIVQANLVIVSLTLSWPHSRHTSHLEAEPILRFCEIMIIYPRPLRNYVSTQTLLELPG